MNKKAILLAVLIVGVFLAGCTSSQDGYATYNQQQGGQQPYVGGGCGVAPNADYSNTPITTSELNSGF